jgi:hypothetical protein
MTTDLENTAGSNIQPVIYVAPLGKLQVYPVYGHELDELSRGAPVALFLNFSLALLASGLSFLANLLATDIQSVKTFNVFVIITVVFLLAGVVLFAVWWKLHRSTRNLVQQIRDRMPPAPGIPE